MRIVTWNCQSGFGKKASVLLAQNPDLAVIPECTERSALALQHSGYNALWFPSDSPAKGLGVFCRREWSMRVQTQPRYKWIVPIAIDAPTPFTLIAVWACRVGARRADNYIGQVYSALMAHPEWFDDRPVVLAGDLNSNTKWDNERKAGNHSDVVKMLFERGLVSGYHEFFGEEHGAESRPTFHLYRHADKPYHLDYIFIPREWASRLKMVEVGTHGEWFGLSDHCPVTVELQDQVQVI